MTRKPRLCPFCRLVAGDDARHCANVSFHESCLRQAVMEGRALKKPELQPRLVEA